MNKTLVIELKKCKDDLGETFIFKCVDRKYQGDWLCAKGLRELWQIPESSHRIWLTISKKRIHPEQRKAVMDVGYYEQVRCGGWSVPLDAAFDALQPFGKTFYVKCEHEV